MGVAKKLVEVIPGYCTTEAVAAFLGLSEQMVRRYRGQLGGIEVNKGSLYPVGVVREFAGRERKPGWTKGKSRSAATT